MASLYLNQLIQKRDVGVLGTVKRAAMGILPPLYIDLHLDLVGQQTIGIGTSPHNINDIRTDVDEVAIKNSVFNLLTMRSGAKIFSPQINTALDQHLFEVISDIAANQIGQTMVDVLERWEPRINVLQVNVTPDIDQQTYSIQLLYSLKARSTVSALTLSINNGQISIL